MTFAVYEATVASPVRGCASLSRPSTVLDGSRIAGVWPWEGLPWPDTVPCAVNLPVLGEVTGPDSAWVVLLAEELGKLAWWVAPQSVSRDSRDPLPSVVIGVYVLAALQRAGMSAEDVRNVRALAGSDAFRDGWPGVFAPLLPQKDVLSDPLLRRRVPDVGSFYRYTLSRICDSSRP